MGFGKQLEISFKNKVAGLLHTLLSQPSKNPTPPYHQILVLRYDVLGDMILSLPVFRLLRKTFPKTRLDALCSSKNSNLLAGTKYVNQIYIYHKNPFHTFRLIRKLRKKGYDLVVNLVTRPSLTFGLISRLIGPRAVRIAADQERFGYFYNRLIELPPKREIHMLNRLFLLNADLIKGDISRVEAPWVQYSQDIKNEAKNLFTGIVENLTMESKPINIAAINISASLPRREWPIEKYAKFLQLAVNKYDDQINRWAIFTNPYKPDEAKHLVRMVAGDRVTVIPPQQDFRVIMEFLRHVYVLITPDTSISHAASAMGTPVLVLMIGENIKIWNPVGVPHQIVLSKDPFSLRELSVKEVQSKFEILMKLLKDD